MSECAIKECGKPARSRGWCEMHYTRYRRHGDPLHRDRMFMQPEGDRFWSKVDATGPCWLWLAGRGSHGYGLFHLNGTGKTVYAHRYAWQSLVGEIPDGLQVDHLCRVRDCVNPDHLQPVTQTVNIQRGNSPSAIAKRSGLCRKGHDRSDAYIRPSGYPECRTCIRERRHNA